MTAPQTTNFSPLEDELQTDVQGVLRRRLLEELGQQAGQIKRVLDNGVSPTEFERLYSLHTAVAAAATVVDKVWQRFHPA